MKTTNKLLVLALMVVAVVFASCGSDDNDDPVVPTNKTTGVATRTGGISVKWVQLWKGGPKFAEYNVGATHDMAEDYGKLYAWGGSQDKVDDHNTGSVVLKGTDDTATKLWGAIGACLPKQSFRHSLPTVTLNGQQSVSLTDTNLPVGVISLPIACSFLRVVSATASAETSIWASTATTGLLRLMVATTRSACYSVRRVTLLAAAAATWDSLSARCWLNNGRTNNKFYRFTNSQ